MSACRPQVGPEAHHGLEADGIWHSVLLVRRGKKKLTSSAQCKAVFAPTQVRYVTTLLPNFLMTFQNLVTMLRDARLLLWSAGSGGGAGPAAPEGGAGC